MANIKSQIKRNLQNEKARQRNKAVRSAVKTQIKTAESAAGTDQGEAALVSAISSIDRAATKGVIHRNAAARQKSRLIRRSRAAASES